MGVIVKVERRSVLSPAAVEVEEANMAVSEEEAANKVSIMVA